LDLTPVPTMFRRSPMENPGQNVLPMTSATQV
jgi:hypothetical protein